MKKLKKYVMGKHTNSGNDAVLPNTTLHGKFSGDTSTEIKGLNIEGKSLIVISESWRTKGHLKKRVN